MNNEFCPYRDCEFYQAYDEGDDYPPVIKCEKANAWIDDALPCYNCEGKWSAEQIQSYVASEEAKTSNKLKPCPFCGEIPDANVIYPT